MATNKEILVSFQRHKQLQQSFANSMWSWMIVVGLVWWLTSWMWALIPGSLAVICIIFSISNGLRANKLEPLVKDIVSQEDLKAKP
ncbi:MAG: hypothetical protein H0W78_02920 [Planctomycetes bacterium]|nr:hypothetical protein [Planctomycetota bacterium]